MSSLLYCDHFDVNDVIAIRIPSVGEIIDHEDDYFDVVCTIVATPSDMMVQLDDAGVDYSAITEFELFLILFKRLKTLDTSMVFGDMKLDEFSIMRNKQNGEYVLRNPNTGAVIDRAIHDKICRFLRNMLHLAKNNQSPANEEARKYLIAKARRKMKRHARKAKPSYLETPIVALVNTSEFPYTYETVRQITIYQFYRSLQQITHKIKYDKTMIGYYAGTIKAEDLRQEDRSWIYENTGG